MIFEHPPSSIEYREVLIDKRKLRFYIGTPEFQWDKPGDGVEFIIEIRSQNTEDGEGTIEHESEREKDEKSIHEKLKIEEKVIFSKYIDPKNNPEHRKWHLCEVDMSRYLGESVDIIFITEPGFLNDHNWDWAGWAEVELSD